MKSKALLLLAFLALIGLAPRPAEARVEVSFDFFYDGLSPYGEWLEVGDYGPCWRPSGVDADWRPYADGYWTYTDGGWTWVSYEDFGGIVYHYGRWVEVEDEGWCWVPDYEWAPAWVSWRSNDDYIGWAPLPPEAHWRRDTGFSVWVDSHYDIGPSRFNFCRTRDFGAPYLRPVIVNRFENATIIVRTANCTNITYYDDHDFGGIVHCGGPSFSFINQHVHRPIPTLKLVHKTNITNINIRNVNIFNAEARGNQLAVAVPRIVAPVKDAPKPRLVRSIPAAKISKGWAGVKDPDVAEGIRTKLRQESRGLTPESAPARRVQAADLRVVPAKADPEAPSTVRTTKSRGPVPTKKPGAVATAPPREGDKAAPPKPVDARTAERMLREQSRESREVKPGVEPPAAPRTVAKPSVPDKVEPREPAQKKPDTGRQAIRSIPPSVVAPPPTVEPRRSAPIERAPVVKSKPSGDDEARARAAAAAAARERSAADARARSAAIERQRAAEDAARRQNAAREMQRRQAAEPPRREAPVEIRRMKPDDSAQRAAAAQSAARQQAAAENARRSQAAAENARRSQAAAENARRSQMEAARRDQAVQAARQQQAAAARQQVQRQAPPPAAPRGMGAPSGKRQLSEEEMEALKKGRGR